jgi:hypothetical protein
MRSTWRWRTSQYCMLLHPKPKATVIRLCVICFPSFIRKFLIHWSHLSGRLDSGAPSELCVCTIRFPCSRGDNDETCGRSHDATVTTNTNNPFISKKNPTHTQPPATVNITEPTIPYLSLTLLCVPLEEGCRIACEEWWAPKRKKLWDFSSMLKIAD